MGHLEGDLHYLHYLHYSFGLRSNNREGTQPCPSTENWIKDLLSMAPPIRTRPSFHLSIGSAGPTTASRMDKYAPKLLDLGLGGMIGKGKRSKEVIDAMVRNGAVYFAAIGGAGALLSKAITESEVVAYDDLGTEAIRKLKVERFPAIVVIDSDGNNLYETADKLYNKEKQ